MPCGLILTELVSNAFKHAFPNRENGEITIDLHRTDDGRLRLLFRDNGIGFPPGFQEDSEGAMGLRLVRDLTLQLQGRLTIRNDHGATVEILMVDQPGRNTDV